MDGSEGFPREINNCSKAMLMSNNQEQKRVLNYKFLRQKKKKKIFAMPVLRDANV